MRLTRVEVHDVRVIDSAVFRPGPGLNLITGANAAGKTSLLEALHILATGRSYTTTSIDRVVRHGSEALCVLGSASSEQRSTRIGVRRQRTGPPEVRVDGSPVSTLAALAERLPLQVVHPRSDALIGGGPAARRQFLDWGVFHVEQTFFGCWRRYRKALDQRNAALRAGAPSSSVRAWDETLAADGEQVDAARRRYLAALAPCLHEVATDLFEGHALALAYAAGWPAGESLADSLARNLERDRRYGQTGQGPHRADLRIDLGGHEARGTASRGQQKLLVYALKLAQLDHFLAATGRDCVLLIDDLPSELDVRARGGVLRRLAATGAQAILSAIDGRAFDDGPMQPQRVFHVERGTLQELI